MSGDVVPMLSLTLGAAADFGAFTPGVSKTYTASVIGNVVSTAGDAALAIADPDTRATGKLVNGAFSLPQPVQVSASSASRGAQTSGIAVGDPARPTELSSWSGPASDDTIAIAFEQSIGAGDALRTSAYGKTLTPTPSTTQP